MYGLDDQTDKWLRSWVSEISHAIWKQPKDVFRQFPQAKSDAENVFLFPVGGNAQWIEVSMMFPLSVAVVIDLKRIN